MKNAIEKVKQAVTAGVVMLIGAVMAGMGLAMVAILAMFALAAGGLAILASPFLAMPKKEKKEDDKDIEMSCDDGVVA